MADLQQQIQPPSNCNIFFYKSTCKSQNFPFPKPILDYITIASTKTYKKLIKTCKYFYASKPILILCLHYNKHIREWSCSPFGKCYLLHFEIDIKKIKPKIWLTHSLQVYGYYQGPTNIASSLIPKLYYSDITNLQISNQIITFDEFLFLTPFVRQIYFVETIIKKKNESVVPMEEIVENLPKLKSLLYTFLIDSSDISTETTQNLININHFKTLTEIDISGIPEIFDFFKFVNFMNANKHIIFRLRFRNSVSQDYKNRVKNYLESIKNEKFNPRLLFHEEETENI